jgi:DNA-binding IclR family transcriptional regulator
VEQDAETTKYRLGPALLELGNAYLDNHELRSRSMLWTESLATRSMESARVGVLNGSNVLIIHHVFRPDNTVQLLEVGASIPWNASALGKALVAFLEEERRARLLIGELPILTGRTVVKQEQLADELTKIASVGYATDDQEAIVGEAGIAAPVFNDAGLVAGSIGVTGAVETIMPDGPDLAKLAAVRDAARSLSRDLGAGRPSIMPGSA